MQENNAICCLQKSFLSVCKQAKKTAIFSYRLLIVFFQNSHLVAKQQQYLLFFSKFIDAGISSKQISIVLYFLMAQFVLFLSYFISDFFSNLILTKFNFILSVDLKKSLLKKLMKLPVNFFDTRLNTETLQRIGDQNKIQQFVTWKGIEFVLNVLNIIIFGSILLYYNHIIFIIYFFLTILSVLLL